MSDCSSSGTDEDLDPELELLDELGGKLSKVNKVFFSVQLYLRLICGN